MVKRARCRSIRPIPRAYMDKVKIMYDLARLAFETDSTRAITLMLDSVEHARARASRREHHRRLPQPLAPRQIRGQALAAQGHRPVAHEAARRTLFADLKAVREGEETLLDRTMVLYGSNFGDANAHTCFNLPTLLAGGGFKHGQHLAFDTRRATIRCRISSSRCFSAWDIETDNSPRPPARCAGWSWM